VDTLAPNVHKGILCADTACTSTTQVAINPKVLPYLALYPLPNGPITGNTGKFAFGAPRLGDENYVIGKIDHYFSPSTTLSGSYTYDDAKGEFARWLPLEGYCCAFAQAERSPESAASVLAKPHQ
jgi:hypothetical protein